MINDIVYKLIGKYSAKWVCTEMEMHYLTLMDRLKKNNWSKAEQLLITKLNNEN